MEQSAKNIHPDSEKLEGSKRRRFWWGLIAIFILIITIPAHIPRPPDGLDFIRKHGPVREVLTSESYVVSRRGFPYSVTVWHQEFTFKAITLDLLMDLQPGQDYRATSTWQTSMLPDGSIATWDLDKGTVSVQLNQEPSWLVRQWHVLLNRFSPVPASRTKTLEH